MFRSYRDSSEPQYFRYDSSFLVVNKKPSTMFHKTIMPNFFICLKPPLPPLQVPPQAHRDVHVLHHPTASPLEEVISAHSVSHLFLHAPPSPTKLENNQPYDNPDTPSYPFSHRPLSLSPQSSASMYSSAFRKFENTIFLYQQI